jgi:2-hydroxy-3-keto-5-methylthiopentenyl-1-phosphate phosphatase
MYNVKIDNFKPLIKDLIEFYYQDLGNCTGGAFHIVLDDGNVEDRHVWFCQEEAEKRNDTFGIFLGQVLRTLTEKEREELYNDSWWGME